MFGFRFILDHLLQEPSEYESETLFFQGKQSTFTITLYVHKYPRNLSVGNTQLYVSIYVRRKLNPRVHIFQSLHVHQITKLHYRIHMYTGWQDPCVHHNYF